MPTEAFQGFTVFFIQSIVQLIKKSHALLRYYLTHSLLLAVRDYKFIGLNSHHLPESKHRLQKML
jgi:hypothetical protein